MYTYTCICAPVCVCVCARAKSLQLCLTLCNPMDCSLPGFSVHGISQARILKWVAIFFFNFLSAFQFSGDLVRFCICSLRVIIIIIFLLSIEMKQTQEVDNSVDMTAFVALLFVLHTYTHTHTCAYMQLPDGTSGKEFTCQCRRHKRCGFDPWVRNIPWRRKGQPTPVLAWRIPWTEEPGRLYYSPLQRVGCD